MDTHACPTTTTNSEVLHEFPFFKVYKDGRVHVHFPQPGAIPAADDPTTGVKIKDVQISPDVSMRVFLPPVSPGELLPVVLYVHGGGFCMMSAFQADYTHFLTVLAARARVVAVSVEYRLFPAHPIPACYDDCWAALLWLASHSRNISKGVQFNAITSANLDPWILDHGDLSRVFLTGDSAGGNISHNLAVRAGCGGLPGGVHVEGIILTHPFFGIGGKDDEMWLYMCPTNEGPRDRRMYPAKEELAALGCRRVAVVVAEWDHLRNAGVRYVEELRESGWQGTVELVENKDRHHCFHISSPSDEEAVAILTRMGSFIHHSKLE